MLSWIEDSGPVRGRKIVDDPFTVVRQSIGDGDIQLLDSPLPLPHSDTAIPHPQNFARYGFSIPKNTVEPLLSAMQMICPSLVASS